MKTTIAIMMLLAVSSCDDDATETVDNCADLADRCESCTTEISRIECETAVTNGNDGDCVAVARNYVGCSN